MMCGLNRICAVINIDIFAKLEAKELDIDW